jgi:hypothetical protein
MSKKTAYVVMKVEWEYTDEYNDQYDPVPIQTFLSYQDASTYCRELEEKARYEKSYGLDVEQRCLNDMRYRDNKLEKEDMWVSFCSLSWQEFQERIRSFNLLSLEHINPNKIEYLTNTDGMWFAKGFWEAVRELPEEQYHAFYDLFDKLNFYEVVEISSDGIEEPKWMLEEQDRRMQAVIDEYNERESQDHE